MNAAERPLWITEGADDQAEVHGFDGCRRGGCGDQVGMNCVCEENGGCSAEKCPAVHGVASLINAGNATSIFSTEGRRVPVLSWRPIALIPVHNSRSLGSLHHKLVVGEGQIFMHVLNGKNDLDLFQRAFDGD